MDEIEATEFILDKMKSSKNNLDFFDMMRGEAGVPERGPGYNQGLFESSASGRACRMSRRLLTGVTERQRERRYPPRVPRRLFRQDLSNGFQVRDALAPRRPARRSRWRTAASFSLYKVETTSESHPFYTGTQKSVATLLGGRVEKFRNKFAHLGAQEVIRAAPTAPAAAASFAIKAQASAAFFMPDVLHHSRMPRRSRLVDLAKPRPRHPSARRRA